MHPVDFEPSPEDASPLAQALGDDFKVIVPYRSRSAEVICRRCLSRWLLPKSATDSPREWLWIRSHADDCQGREHRPSGLLGELDDAAA